MVSLEDALLARKDAETLQAKARTIEDTLGRHVSIPEFANAVGASRYTNGKNPTTFVSRPDLKLLAALYKNGFYDIGNPRNEPDFKVNSGLNNRYLSWPAVFSFFGAFHTARQRPESTNFMRFFETAYRFFPGVRLDLRNHQIVDDLCRRSGGGEEYRDAFTRAMYFSLLGEAFQGLLYGQCEQELRGEILGIIVMDYLFNEEGIKQLQQIAQKNGTERYISGIENLEQYQGIDRLIQTSALEFMGMCMVLMDHEEIIHYDSHPYYRLAMAHFQKQATFLGTACVQGLGFVLRAADRYASFGQLPGIRFLHKSLSPSMPIDQYHSLEYGHFPDPITTAEDLPCSVLSKYPSLIEEFA